MKPCSAPSTVGVPPELLVCPQSQRASVRNPARWNNQPAEACEWGVSSSDWNNHPAKRLVNVRILPVGGGIQTFRSALASGLFQPLEDSGRLSVC